MKIIRWENTFVNLQYVEHWDISVTGYIEFFMRDPYKRFLTTDYCSTVIIWCLSDKGSKEKNFNIKLKAWTDQISEFLQNNDQFLILR